MMRHDARDRSHSGHSLLLSQLGGLKPQKSLRETPGQPTNGGNVQPIESGFRALTLVMNLNWDRLFFLGTIIVGLLAGAFLGSTIGTMAIPH